MQNASKGTFKKFNAASYRVALVVAEFNRDITSVIADRALKTLNEYGVPKEHITVYTVPGSVEIPTILQALATAGACDAAIAVGAIIRGATDHYIHVAQIVVDGVSRAIAAGLPVGFGVLTVENHEQARERLDIGRDATVAALHTAKMVKKIRKNIQ